jgi:hypothetical protein
VQRALERLAVAAEAADSTERQPDAPGEPEQFEQPEQPEQSKQPATPAHCLFCSPRESDSELTRLFGMGAYSDESPELLRGPKPGGAGPRANLIRPELAMSQSEWVTPRNGAEALQNAIDLERNVGPRGNAAALDTAHAEEAARVLAWNAERLAQLGSLALWGAAVGASVELRLPPMEEGAEVSDLLAVAMEVEVHLHCAAALAEALGLAWGALPEAALRPLVRGSPQLRLELSALLRQRALCFERLVERGVDAPLVECARVCGLICSAR